MKVLYINEEWKKKRNTIVTVFSQGFIGQGPISSLLKYQCDFIVYYEVECGERSIQLFQYRKGEMASVF